MAAGALRYLPASVPFGGTGGVVWVLSPHGVVCRTTTFKGCIFQGVLPMGPVGPCCGAALPRQVL